MQKILVSKKEKIKTITDALSIISNKEDVLIELDEGIYYEKISIPNSNVTIKGKGIDKTKIIYDDYSKKIHKDGRDYNTFRTATVTITGNNCKIMDLTIENPSPSKEKGQAVALSVLGNYFSGKNIKIKSEQDTLLLGPLPDDLKERYTNFLPSNELFIEGDLMSKFDNCIIEGTLDFIFGSGKTLFSNCKIYSSSSGYVVAPSHSLFQKTGFIFYKCNFLKTNENVNNVCLLRLWRPYGKSCFINCTYEDHIKIEALQGWNNKKPEVYSRIYEYPRINGRVSWMNDLSKDDYSKILELINKEFEF